MSIIRAVDRVTLNALGPDAPPEVPEGAVFSATLLIALKSGDARGRNAVVVRQEQPSGQYLSDHTMDVMFEGDERGVNLVLNLTFPAIEGLHWFDVLVNNKPLTRVPLRVIHQRAPRSG